MSYGDTMGTVNIVLPDDLEKKLRVAVAEMGGKKGDLSNSVVDAIKEWLQRNDRQQEKSRR